MWWRMPLLNVGRKAGRRSYRHERGLIALLAPPFFPIALCAFPSLVCPRFPSHVRRSTRRVAKAPFLCHPEFESLSFPCGQRD
jgi:hypothetical protein